MAGAELIGRSAAVWSEQGTTPDAIEAALRKLLVQVHGENDDFLPARVLNMIAFVDLEWTGEIANRLRGVGRYHASRLVVLAYEPRRKSLDARVMIASEAASAPGELAPLRETVVVRLGDRHLDDLLTIADPLVVTDLPTLLWSPHGHPDTVDALLGLAQATLLDSIDEPDQRAAIDRAYELAQQVYVVDLAWLRSTPWRERVATVFDPHSMREELRRLSAVTVSHHPDSRVAALLLVGWLASRLGWSLADSQLTGEGSRAKMGVTAQAEHGEVLLTLKPAPQLQVPGLACVELSSATGLRVRLEREPGGLRADKHDPGGRERTWTLLGASRGEGGILGEGIRQALLRDPTYGSALTATQQMFHEATRV